jgi:hypothetical protein
MKRRDLIIVASEQSDASGKQIGIKRGRNSKSVLYDIKSEYNGNPKDIVDQLEEIEEEAGEGP